MISEQDIHYLASYVDRWHNHWRMEMFSTPKEIQVEVYSSIAANDILDQVLQEHSRIPLDEEDERRLNELTVVDVIASYAAMVYSYAEKSTFDQAKNLFTTQYYEAMCMWLDYILRKDENECF